MRVLAVSQTYFPYLVGGGRPVAVRALADGLRAHGHEVTVLTADLGPLDAQPGGSDLDPRPSPYGLRTTQDGVDVVYLRSLLEYRLITVNPTLARFCRDELPGYDIVHIFGIYDIMGAVVAAHCRRRGIPYVLEPLGMFRPVSRSVLPKRAYHLAVGARLVRGAARVIATSELERRELLEGGVPPERIVYRRNGVATPPSGIVRGAFRRRFGVPAQARVALFLGRLVRKKGPDILLRAFARVAAAPAPDGRPWHLVMVGPEERDRFGAELQALARELGVEDRVTFTGAIHGDETWGAYTDADVFVLPSWSENFAITVAESMMVGTPVIVSDRCGIAEWVRLPDAEAGIVIPVDADALAAAMMRLAADPALERRYRAGCRTIGARLAWDEPVAETDALYRELTGHRVAAAV